MRNIRHCGVSLFPAALSPSSFLFLCLFLSRFWRALMAASRGYPSFETLAKWYGGPEPPANSQHHEGWLKYHTFFEQDDQLNATQRYRTKVRALFATGELHLYRPEDILAAHTLMSR
jgi:hypothetical protein